MTQYVPELAQDGQSIIRHSPQARENWLKKVDEFYGPDFLNYADSDSEREDSEDSEQIMNARNRLTRKKEFKNQQIRILEEMVAPGQHPKVILSLMDSGIGIKVEDQMKLFKLFGCLESTRKVNTKGVGL